MMHWISKIFLCLELRSLKLFFVCFLMLDLWNFWFIQVRYIGEKTLKRTVFLIIVFSFSFNTIGNAQQLGKYFSKKEYSSQPLPVWSETKDRLPSPILDGNPGWVDMYWECWEIAFRGFKKPIPQSPFVSTGLKLNPIA